MHKRIQQTALRLKDSEEGFALIAAIMACLILLALGMLVVALSTQDIRMSARVVGDKRSLVAAEEGIHSLSQAFNPLTATTAAKSTVSRSDGVSSYTINYPATRPTTGPVMIPLTGYAVGGGQQWGQSRYNISVTGANAQYGTQVTIGVGLGYGPVEMSTMSR
jgi:Tfp pilus assembly protein PilX